MLRVELIVWHDASKEDRKEFNPDLMVLSTWGPVIHEDKKQVILGHELEHRQDYMSRSMDYTQIPKKMIIKRVVIGEVQYPVEIKVKRRKPDAQPAKQG